MPDEPIQVGDVFQDAHGSLFEITTARPGRGSEARRYRVVALEDIPRLRAGGYSEDWINRCAEGAGAVGKWGYTGRTRNTVNPSLEPVLCPPHTYLGPRELVEACRV